MKTAMEQKPGPYPFIAAVLGWVWVLALVGHVDLRVAASVTRPEHPFGVAIQRYGTLPSGILYGAAILWLVVPSLRRRSRLLSLAASALLAQALLHPLLVTDLLLKRLWGRLRPHQVLAGEGRFTPFYLPSPRLEGRSFPSGHVATASVLAPVVLLLVRCGRRQQALILGAVVLAWALAVAFGRVLFGAHFLSDVAFSMGLAWFVSPLTLRLGERYLALFDKQAA